MGTAPALHATNNKLGHEPLLPTEINKGCEKLQADFSSSKTTKSADWTRTLKVVENLLNRAEERMYSAYSAAITFATVQD